MNYSLCTVLLILKCFFVNTSTGIPNNVKEEGRIVGGQDAKPYSHPYIISLQTRIFYLRIHFCGGALLNEYFILSAAHCVTESWLISWLPMDAVAGVHNVDILLGQTTQIRQISERIPHPLYNGGIGSYDIGLFKTIRPFRFTKAVQPIKLSTGYNYRSNTDTLKLIGWGALRTTFLIPDRPINLQEVNVTYIPFDECYDTIDIMKEINEENPLDENSNLCTGAPASKVTACVGDSGGPLVQMHGTFPLLNDPVESNTEMYNEISYNCTNDNEGKRNCINDINGKGNDDNKIEQRKPFNKPEPLLLGIVSWGISPCGELGAPTVYTNVSTFTDFINYHIRNSV